MCKLFGVLGMAFLFACSPAERPEAEGDIAASGSVDAAPEPTGYTEYIWCSNGENYSQKSSDARNEMWVEALNDLGMSSMAAAEITPSGWSSENFDRSTVLFWENKESRDAGWEAYLAAGVEEKLEKAYPGVEVCGGEGWQNVYPTNSYSIREAKLDKEFKVGYQFCDFNEGKVPEDLRAFVRGPWAEFLKQYDSQNPLSTYGLNINTPDFDNEAVEVHEGVPETFDYIWVNLWGDAAELDRGWSAVDEYGEGMMKAVNEVAVCSQEQVWDGRNIKTRS